MVINSMLTRECPGHSEHDFQLYGQQTERSHLQRAAMYISQYSLDSSKQ